MRKFILYISWFVFISICLICLLGPCVTGIDPSQQFVEIRNQPPSASHLFGTDMLGRDIFTRVCIGGRNSLWIAFLCTFITTIVGCIYGGLSALVDKLDKPLLFFLDVLVSIPDILLILTLTLYFQHKGISTIILIISLLGWCKMAKLVRDILKPLRNSDYVIQPRLFHKNIIFIVIFHMIPNIFSIIISRSILSFTSFMFYETFISYLGIGIQPPDVSWGSLISNLKDTFISNPYQVLSFCSLLFFTMLSVNALGETFADQQSVKSDNKQLDEYKLNLSWNDCFDQQSQSNVIDYNTILSLKNLSVAYNNHIILNNISFDVKEGEILGIIGHSGCGKSTLAKAITGTLKYYGGEIMPSSRMFFDGKEVCLQGKKGYYGIRGPHGIAVIPQNAMDALDPTMKIRDQLNECIQLTGKRSKAETNSITAKILEEVGLDSDCLSKFPHNLSGGIAQRIMIALAVVLEPKLLICDESTSALDIDNQDRIIDLIKRITRSRNIAALFISHDMRVINQLATRVIKIHNGEITQINQNNLPINKHCNEKEKVNCTSFKELLRVNGLTAGYSRKQWILHDISFSLGVGETLGVFGESGSGKTTLIKSLLKCLAIPQLPIYIKDKHAIQGSESLRVQYISQNPFESLDPHWRIKWSLLEAGIKEKDFEKILNDVGLDTSVLSSKPNQLSIGQCQRIAIARAISCIPQLLICDEPTSSVDVGNQKLIMKLLSDLIVQKNIASIFISHDLGLLQNISTRSIYIEKGRIVENKSSLC